ncbi:MBL fold metallo-hydrolase [Pelagibius marinus]|uniref:MBL fold metallo-hydrolase n=1 Tax=Pelagibius marinus TaxID=2762760 RepID=UPI00187284CF|nr:MBL fold metallo-hydrolase [Pelagibius marinus]
MIFQQYFEPVTCSFSYLIARRRGGEALLVDPLRDQMDLYLDRLARLDLRLVKAVDTHLHADHVTALGGLRRRTGCTTMMGAPTRCELVDLRLQDEEVIDVDGLKLRALHTPGHTADSFCFVAADFVLTGDTLLIHGTGRTDFEDGDAGAQYDSLHGKLLHLPEETLVYPGHDYKGRKISSIAEERALNPRLNVGSREAYIELMAGLDLPPPRQMAVAVPANLMLGLPARRRGAVGGAGRARA